VILCQPIFLDSNIIIKYYIDESGSDWVRDLVDNPDHLCVISEIAVVEVAAALARIHRERRIGRKRMETTYAKFQEDLHSNLFLTVTLSAEVLDRAAQIALQRVVKGYDALQIASAATAEYLGNFEIVFVSDDTQVVRAAQEDAMETAGPPNQSTPSEPLQ
jgi:predicted nucleic acid-binding protein